MNLFHDLELWKEDLSEVNAIIEIPKDSSVKYEFDKNLWCIMLDRVWRTPISYTFNYWLLPRTWNKDDNDPLDIIVLSRFPFHPWVVVPCRVVWGLKMTDSWEFDYKIVAVSDDKYYDHVEDIDDISEMEKEDIHYFMQRYKDLHWKKVDLEWWDKKEEAIKVLSDCKDYYKVKFSK